MVLSVIFVWLYIPCRFLTSNWHAYLALINLYVSHAKAGCGFSFLAWQKYSWSNHPKKRHNMSNNRWIGKYSNRTSWWPGSTINSDPAQEGKQACCCEPRWQSFESYFAVPAVVLPLENKWITTFFSCCPSFYLVMGLKSEILNVKLQTTVAKIWRKKGTCYYVSPMTNTAKWY